MNDPTPTKVLAISHTAAVGGAELALARLFEAIPKDTFELRVIVFEDGDLVPRLRRAGVRVDVARMGRLTRANRNAVGRSVLSLSTTALRVAPFALRLLATLRSTNFDVLYANTLKAGLIAVPLARLLRRPVVWHIHDRISADYLPSSAIPIIRRIAGLADVVICNSVATAATLGDGIKDKRIAYPGFSAGQVAATLRVRPESPLVGMLGRISPTKGQLEFVRAASLVHAVRPDVQFQLVGAPLFGQEAYADQVRETIDSLGLRDFVRLMGPTSSPHEVLDSFTLFVHASPVPEPFGQVIVEAMIRGVPVIATDAGGVSEILHSRGSGETMGWLVPPGDPEALSVAIQEALGDPCRADSLARLAYREARERFPISRTVRVVTRAWKDAADVRGR